VAHPHALTVLTNAAAVRALTRDQAAQRQPVHLRGIVVLRGGDRALTVLDGTGGIYVDATNRFDEPFQRGDVVGVEGVSEPGRYAPCVRVGALTRLGRASIPAAPRVTLDELLSGGFDAQWVEVAGVVRRVEPAPIDAKSLHVSLFTGGGRLSVTVPAAEADRLAVAAEVRLSGVCFHQFNKAGQVLNPFLMVPEGEAVTTVRPAPADLFSLPVRATQSLKQFRPGERYGSGVRVRGVVTYGGSDDGFWLRDEGRGLQVRTGLSARPGVGDVVDVFGFISRGGYSPLLEDAVFRRLGRVTEPAPVRLGRPVEALDHDADLVELEAELRDFKPVLGGYRLSLASGAEEVVALLATAADGAFPREWRPGCRVRLAGICQAQEPPQVRRPGTLESTSFHLLLRSPEDVQVLRPPPWWTVQHVAWLLGLVAGVLLLSTLGVSAAARLRHLKQLRARRLAEAEFAAVLNERNRMARELHDTLAQGLGAISMQLEVVKRKLPPDSAARGVLDEARSLTRDNLKEARNAIWNMRSQVLEAGDLAAALDGLLKTLTDARGITAAFDVRGQARRFAPVIENNILRVGQEAITNAARHAQARRIEVSLDFEERRFRLTVRDDGCGFDTARPPRSEGGFGLVGMRERAEQMNAELSVDSEPGTGTVVRLTVPVPGWAEES
jgi:signal transduction histidine kinase